MQPLDDLELYRMLFEFSSDPQYILDRDKNTFVMVNSAFKDILGYSERELYSGKIRANELIHPEDRGRVAELERDDKPVTFDRYEIRILDKSGKYIDVEFTVHNLDLGGKPVRLGSFRNISKRKDLERKLKEEADLQRVKAIETAKSTVRVGQLLDKIRSTPEHITMLLNAEDEQDLFRRAGDILIDPRGFNVAGVTFLMKEENYLTVAYSTGKLKRKKYDLTKNTKYARAARGEKAGLLEEKNLTEEGFRLLGKDRLIGLLHVKYKPEERFLFDEGSTIRKGVRDLIRTLARTLVLMIENIRLLRKTEEQATIDIVSDTFNRRYFDRKVKDEFARAYRYKRDMSIIVMDIDKFKNINDTWGHQQGDVILYEVAQLFKASSREVDIICRYGGDEFVILLPETNFEEAVVKAEKLRKLTESRRFSNEDNPKKPFRVTLSIGVTSNQGCPNETTMFRRADDALYKAKGGGRNRVVGADENGEDVFVTKKKK